MAHFRRTLSVYGVELFSAHLREWKSRVSGQYYKFLLCKLYFVKTVLTLALEVTIYISLSFRSTNQAEITGQFANIKSHKTPQRDFRDSA